MTDEKEARMKHLKYLWYLLKHKWYVAVECFRHGLYWQGIVHDLSKFLPSEWFSYVDYFYGEGAKRGAFDLAWLSHQKRNKHHWQYWVLVRDEGVIEPLEMSGDLVIEMVCDWIGAGKAQGRSSADGSLGIAREWYAKNSDKLCLHPKTASLGKRFLGLD